MKSVDEYTDEIRKVFGMEDGVAAMTLNYKFNSPKEAKTQIATIRHQQKELRLIKRDVSNTIKLLRADYRSEATNVQAGFWATMAGKKSAGRERALKKDNIKRQEIAAITPYEGVVGVIDKLLVQLDKVKLDIEREALSLE